MNYRIVYPNGTHGDWFSERELAKLKKIANFYGGTIETRSIGHVRNYDAIDPRQKKSRWWELFF